MQEAWVPSLGWEEPLEKGNGNPVQYPCLEDHVDRGAWWAAVHGVTESQTSLTAPHIIADWCECWLPPVGSLKTGWMSHKGTSCVSAWKPVTWTLSQREREILSPQGLGEEFPNSQLHRSGMTRSRPFSDQISSLSTFLSGVWILGHICHWDGSGDLFSDFENLIWFELRDFQASLGSLHTF